MERMGREGVGREGSVKNLKKAVIAHGRLTKILIYVYK